MKIAISLYSEYNLESPMELETNENASDCFGNEWDISDQTCKICASNKVCGMVYQKTITKKKIQELEQQNDYLDMTEKLNDSHYEFYNKIVSPKIESEGGYPAKLVMEYFSIVSGTKNNTILIEMLREFCKRFGYKVENKIIKKQ